MAKPRRTLFAAGRANRRASAGAIQGLVVSNLQQTMDQIAQSNASLAREAGDVILRNTLPKTPKDTGALRETGRVEPGQSRSGNTTVQVKFGNADIDYAVFVHEDKPEGVAKRYTTPGTGPKYLQQGAAESVDEIDSLLRSKLKAVVTGGTGGTGSGS